jgi:hypothetical protein
VLPEPLDARISIRLSDSEKKLVRYPSLWPAQRRRCSRLSAPKLRDVYPEFADKYSHLFRNGSHWRITDAEFDKLADGIRQAGRRYSSV